MGTGRLCGVIGAFDEVGGRRAVWDNMNLTIGPVAQGSERQFSTADGTTVKSTDGLSRMASSLHLLHRLHSFNSCCFASSFCSSLTIDFIVLPSSHVCSP